MAMQASIAVAMFRPKLRLPVIHDPPVTSYFFRKSSCLLCTASPLVREVIVSVGSLQMSSSSNECLKWRFPDGLKSSTRLTRKSVHNCPSASLDSNISWPGDNVKPTQRKTDLQVVLVSPQIPGNTGCIARTCAAAAVGLHLIEPLGFEINSAKLKRAGLDYWPSQPLLSIMPSDYDMFDRYVVVKVHSSWAEFLNYFQEQEGDKRLLGFTKKGTLPHTDVKYRPGDWLMFGSETEGIPSAALEECSNLKYGGGTVRIPIDETYVRCLNLSVAAGIGVYEALRQVGFSENMLNTSSRRTAGDGAHIVKGDIFC